MSNKKSYSCAAKNDVVNVKRVRSAKLDSTMSRPVSSSLRTPYSTNYKKTPGNSYYEIYLAQKNKNIQPNTTKAPTSTIEPTKKANNDKKMPIRLSSSKKLGTHDQLTEEIKSVQENFESEKSSIEKDDQDTDVQEYFKLRVQTPADMIEELCTTCIFKHYISPTFSKPLVVFDVDKILPYFTSKERQPSQTELNDLKEFFTTINVHYNIAIWSAMKMRDIIHLLETYSLTDENNCFKISFCLDISSVVEYNFKSMKKITIKPLEVIWNFYEEYHSHNTILIDNNWQKYQFFSRYEFKEVRAQQIRFYEDKKLYMLAKFLCIIASSGKNFTKLNLCLKED